MPTKALVADHKSAIVDLAKTVGMQVIHDSGPALDGRLIIIADDTFAHTYLHGGPKDTDGVEVKVYFNTNGEVERAYKKVDGVLKGGGPMSNGNAGQRLLWTLHLFSRR